MKITPKILMAALGHHRTETFTNWGEFEKWRETEEKMSKSWLVKQRSDRMTKQCKTSWFYCNRTGENESKESRKRSVRNWLLLSSFYYSKDRYKHR